MKTNFLGSWLREDVREKEERTAEAGEKNEEERGKRGVEKRKKKRTKRRESKEVTVCFLWRLLEIFSQGEVWRGVVVFLGETSWRSLRNCLILSLILVRMCEWCLM